MKKRIGILSVVVVIFFTTVSFKSDFFEIAKQIEIFTTLFKELNMNYVDEVNPSNLMDKAIKGMLQDLDPYTVYWNEQQVEDAKISKSGVYTGIGASVRHTKNSIVIIEPYQNYPADKAGLKAGDEIIQIGSVSLAEFEDDAGELLKGAPGSTVEITYKRQGKIAKANITRGAVELHAVPFYKLMDDNIGYIVLSQFNAKTTHETKEALINLKNQGANKIILDLRGNPGGLLNEAISIVNLFVPKGEVITSTKSHIKKYNKIYRTTQEPVDTQIPLVVLINGRSASASEIVAGGLQDLDRAVIIGARSFGKGLVQRPQKLTYGTQLKVTISKYYTPSGRCIQAVDYGERDENGDPIRLDPKNYNAFKTKGGRTVYDGGGILPDIELATAAYSPITTALMRDNAIFDYATKYYYSHKLSDWKNFKFTDADFKDFLKFLKDNNFSYETISEKKFTEGMKLAEEELEDPQVEQQFKQLLATINAAKSRAVSDKKMEIESILTDEILKRYFYREGLYNYQLTHNPEILEAVKVLKNQEQYHKILR
ncbi:MAG TPA: S41 family peptidase [Flavobacteriaceae bacterium]|nr:S41 family peptidase [Flavobacteriaceae bacterium]